MVITDVQFTVLVLTLLTTQSKHYLLALYRGGVRSEYCGLISLIYYLYETLDALRRLKISMVGRQHVAVGNTVMF